jgi:hypothetical protein
VKATDDSVFFQQKYFENLFVTLSIRLRGFFLKGVLRFSLTAPLHGF